MAVPYSESLPTAETHQRELAVREQGLALHKPRAFCQTEWLSVSPGEAITALKPLARNPRRSTRLSSPQTRGNRDHAVALEVDGPTHFVGRVGRERRRETGPTALKARLLRWAGRRTVAVRHWEWGAAGQAGVGGQRRYLEGLLRSPKAVWGVVR